MCYILHMYHKLCFMTCEKLKVKKKHKHIKKINDTDLTVDLYSIAYKWRSLSKKILTFLIQPGHSMKSDLPQHIEWVISQ